MKVFPFFTFKFTNVHEEIYTKRMFVPRENER